MPQVTYYVALPFVWTHDGVAAGDAVECPNSVAALMRADVFSRQPDNIGAVAFSRTSNPATGHFDSAKLIGKFGDVPRDLFQ